MSAGRRWAAAAGLLLLAWFAAGTGLWLLEAGGVGVASRHFLDAVRSDWMVVLFVNDLLVLLALVCLWVWRDTGRSGPAPGRRWAWVTAVLLLGSPGLLLYLAARRAPAGGGAELRRRPP